MIPCGCIAYVLASFAFAAPTNVLSSHNCCMLCIIVMRVRMITIVINCKERFTMMALGGKRSIVNELLGEIEELKAQNALLLKKVATVERGKH